MSLFSFASLHLEELLNLDCPHRDVQDLGLKNVDF